MKENVAIKSLLISSLLMPTLSHIPMKICANLSAKN